MRTGLLVLLLCSFGLADTNWQNDGLNNIFPTNAGNHVLLGGAPSHNGLSLITQGGLSIFDGASHFTSIYTPTLGVNMDWMLPSSHGVGCLKDDGNGNLSIGACGSGGGDASYSFGSNNFTGTGDFTTTGTVRVDTAVGLGEQSTDRSWRMTPDGTTHNLNIQQYCGTGWVTVASFVSQATPTPTPTPTPAPDNPSTLCGSNLTLWVLADQIVGKSDGDSISTWSDQSGNGNDLSVGSNYPTYKTAIINGKPVVRFNGTSNHLDSTTAISTLLGTSEYSTWVVTKINSFAGNTNPAYWENSTVWTDKGVANISESLYTSGSDDDFVFEHNGSYPGIRIVTPGPGNTFIAYMAGAIIGGNMHLNASINNGTVADIARTRSSLGSAVLEVGANYSTGKFLDGDIAEMVFCKAALSSGDNAKMQSYLNNKYAAY